MNDLNSVNIRPGVNILAVLPHLNYKAWFALAEFVDNSIQSTISRKKDLQNLHGDRYKLSVQIDFNPQNSTIIIKDNAAGISSKDYQRAFRPAEIPPDTSGLSEFGMGMKSAACWFAPNWSVSTSSLGEHEERAIFFDINKIIEDRIEELNIVSRNVSKNKHYTEVRLENIRKFPRGKTITKIKEHLASIYRAFIRDQKLELLVDGEELKFESPNVLEAPSYRDPEGEAIKWKKEINIDLGEGRSATGFVAIRKVADTRLAGLSLFRRNRLVLGSVDETYRPEDIFGRPNTYPYQRIFGEINLRGFFVSHTKDGVKWEECEEDFLSKLRKAISDKNFPLLQQAREHRSKSGAKATRNAAAEALKSTANKLQGSQLSAPNAPVTTQTKNPSVEHETQNELETELPSISANDTETAEIRLTFRGTPWTVNVELSYAENSTEWLAIKDTPSINAPDPRQIKIRIAMLHPFMAQYPTLDSQAFSAILRLVAAISLAEVLATELAERRPSSVRRLTNEILRNVMSENIQND